MKSNPTKAVQVQDMLLDLFEKVESGHLVGLARFSRVLETEYVFSRRIQVSGSPADDTGSSPEVFAVQRDCGCS